jgi:hypothetical protein
MSLLLGIIETMDKPLDNIQASTARATPKDFFLWAAAMVTLYGSIIAFINLLFGYINYVFQDAANPYFGSPYDNGISYFMAAFIVFGAAALILMRVIHSSIEKDKTRADIWVRRWALYLTLFLAGITILIDLIVLLDAFFAGWDFTPRFLLKVAVVLLTASGTFMHFLADVRGYWNAQPKRANSISIAVTLVAVLTVASGFIIVGSPWQARHYRIDQDKVFALMDIQSRIAMYWQQKTKLPATLADLNDPLGNYQIPTDAQNGEQYEYMITGPMTFKLCATFNDASQTNSSYARSVPVAPGQYGPGDNWMHGAGRTCFSRTIDPERYPPLTPIKK